MTRICALIVALCFMGFFSCQTNSVNADSVSLRFDWTTNMSFCGDVYAMYDFAKKNGIKDFKCQQAGEGIDPIKLVLSGTDNFGIVSYEKLLSANEKGADLVALGFINNSSPTVFVTKDSLKFSIPKDFEGKRVGIMPGGATEMVYRGFVKKMNCDLSKITDVPTGFDLQGFLNNQYDVKLSFIYIENVALDEKLIKYNMIEPRTFGVVFPGRVYFARKKFIDNNKKLTQCFINSVIDGWQASLENPDSAIALLKKYDNTIDVTRERKSFEKGRSYFNGFNNQLLMIDETKLPEMVKLLKDVGQINNTNYLSSLDLSFVKNYYSVKSKK